MKLGLALSGGGFRAAFFHLGVIAQMARLGLLSHVEVISTVSGGSIIGALVYLHIKRLLEAKRDDTIRDDDYLVLVERIERDFLTAVERNIRVRTLLDPFRYIRRNPRFWVGGGQRLLERGTGFYSRTDRLGELFDEYLYRPVVGGTEPVLMRKLAIQPVDAAGKFDLESMNERRAAKVPTLLINATVLNTGHNWRFDARSMGECVTARERSVAVDGNMQLPRPLSYEAMPPTARDMTLGGAVAASACVPGLFPPLAIDRLYPEIVVQLVDGGVHDNQGIQGILDEKCSVFIVSDASAPMPDQLMPAIQTGAVIARTNDILMDRLREEQLRHLLARQESVAYVHLRHGRSPKTVAWIGQAREATTLGNAGFEAHADVQDLLSGVRTDLDSFTEVEAYSLMLLGYWAGERELTTAKGIRELIVDPSPVGTPKWKFLQVAPWMKSPTSPYVRQLRVASHRLFKVLRGSWIVAGVTFIVVAALFVLAFFVASLIDPPGPAEMAAFLFMSWIVALAAVLGTLGLRSRGGRWIFGHSLPPSIGLLFIAPVAWMHLHVLDRCFLRWGRVSRLRPPR